MMGAGTIGVGALMYLIFNEPERTEGPVASRFDVASPVVMAEGSDPRLVNSGTSSVPPFPSVMRVENDEFLLVGLGIRTVSFISIQVYVVGFYVHRDDVEVLRKAVEKRVGGKEALRSALTDPVEGERVWEELLSGGAKFRSAFRIVPTRNTGVLHMTPRLGVGLD